MAMGEEWDSFDAHAAPPSSPKPRQFDRTRRGSVSAESYDPAKGSSQAPLSIPKTASERERLVRVTGQNLLMRGIAPENRQPVVRRCCCLYMYAITRLDSWMRCLSER